MKIAVKSLKNTKKARLIEAQDGRRGWVRSGARVIWSRHVPSSQEIHALDRLIDQIERAGPFDLIRLTNGFSFERPKSKNSYEPQRVKYALEALKAERAELASLIDPARNGYPLEIDSVYFEMAAREFDERKQKANALQMVTISGRKGRAVKIWASWRFRRGDGAWVDEGRILGYFPITCVQNLTARTGYLPAWLIQKKASELRYKKAQSTGFNEENIEIMFDRGPKPRSRKRPSAACDRAPLEMLPDEEILSL